MRKKTKEEFILAANKKYNNKFDYSKVVYKNTTSKVIIICPEHGELNQTPLTHLKGIYGCSVCAYEANGTSRRLDTKKFIDKAQKAHNNFYSYEKAVYVKSLVKIIITCPEHGEFLTVPSRHLQGHGCPSCALEKIKQSQRSTTKKFIDKAQKVHNNFYSYEKTDYKNSRTPVIIICPEHGEFNQTPHVHLSKQGCRLCGIIKTHKSLILTTENFIKKAKQVHSNFYNYEKTDYRDNNHTKVIITCPEHGEFNQTPNSHLQGSGCPDCSVLKTKPTLTTNEFIEKSKDMHGDLYGYEKVNYINSREKVIIKCKYHDDFNQLASDHMQGHGCPICANELRNLGDTIANLRKDGIDYDGILYLIECFDDYEHFYKIGITRRSVKKRYGSKLSMPYDYNIIINYQTSIINAWEIEQNFLNIAKTYDVNYFPDKYFGGITECVSVNPIDIDIKLKELYKQEVYFNDE